MRFKLSDGYTGVTTMTRKKFESILLDGISIVAWEEEDALVSRGEE